MSDDRQGRQYARDIMAPDFPGPHDGQEAVRIRSCPNAEFSRIESVFERPAGASARQYLLEQLHPSSEPGGHLRSILKAARRPSMICAHIGCSAMRLSSAALAMRIARLTN
ncbi:hypothetical protein NDS46_16465 [Paenibacillus thiaminolyticus]|uniref:hypothetical protein n=1 Tax=Paenibacillus thiaminolyticus TaxID=49283 RepID=UPI002330D006|nr:hypothetical protein [Paenibacillus thiaminolyticus]WCF05964.1 hypothetical protein NDS46_16465 [Paenibacillus thiaminolyticus]